MARFLVVVVPVVARVWPAVAIGEALADAGHEVAYCGPETSLRPLVSSAAVIYPTGKRSYRQIGATGRAAVRELWDEYVLPLNRFIAHPVGLAVADHRPDVVLTDQYALAGALAAERHGVRWATLAAGVLELTPPIDDPGLRDWVHSKVRQVIEAQGLPADDNLNPLFSPQLVIATTVGELTGVAVPGHWALIGAALGTRRTDPGFAWDWWDPGQRHVLVTSGTLSEHLVSGFLKRLMTVLGSMTGRVQVVVNAGSDVVPDPPPNVLMAPRIPMLELMPRLDAVICNSGQSTVNEALVNGVPLVLAPIRLGELATADQVAKAGAGIIVSMSETTNDQLAAAVTAVLDEPGYHAQARRMAQAYAAAGGAGAAAERLATLAARVPARGDDPLGPRERRHLGGTDRLG